VVIIVTISRWLRVVETLWGMSDVAACSRGGSTFIEASAPRGVGRGCAGFRGRLVVLEFPWLEGNWPVVKLRVRAGESIQEAVRRFRKLCERSGLRKEMRRKAYYEKPSERRRREELKRLRKARQHQVSRV